MRDGARTEIASRGFRRRLGRAPALVVAATLIAVVVSWTQATAIPLAASYTVLGPPYSGTGETFGEVLLGPCAGAYETPVLPAFDLANGHYEGALNVSTSSCSAALSTVQGEFYEIFQPQQQFSVPADGFYHLWVNGSMTFTVNLSAQVGGKGQTAIAKVSVETQAYVLNVTSGAEYAIGASSASYSHTSGFSTHSKKITFALTNDTELAHVVNPMGPVLSYAVVIEWLLVAEVTVSKGSSSAYALINMGFAGKDATITSITFP